MSGNNVEVEGVIRFFVDLKVSVGEMKDWDPLRISAFFEGIALAERAYANKLPSAGRGERDAA